MKRILMKLLALALMLVLLPVAQAVEYTGQETSLVIRFPYEGISFSLYRVADVEADGGYKKTDAFATVPVDLTGAEKDDFPVLAETLAYYAQWRQIQPDQIAVVGYGGEIRISGLKPGLYLVTANAVTVGGKTYTAKPFLVELPVKNEATGAWEDSVTLVPKPGELPPAGGDDLISRKVLKIWDDEGAEQRPAFITVHLLCDGKIVESVKLRAADQWRWRWDDLSEGHEWTVIEEPVPGYTTEIRREGITFVITNRRTTEPGDDPDDPDDPVPPGGEDPDSDDPAPPGGDEEPEVDPVPGEDPRPDEPKLPQTGLLWWPVPVLAGTGMTLFVAGWISRRRDDDE